MKYELSHDSIAHQVFEKAAAELKAGRRVRDLVSRQLERHLENPAILLSKEDLEEIQPFLAVVPFSDEEKTFIRRSQSKIRLRKKMLTGAVIGFIVFLTALSIWALTERSKSRMQQRRSTALALASKSLEYQINDDYTLSLKSAVYAAEITENDETRRALVKAVFNSPGIFYYHKLSDGGDNVAFSPVAPYNLLSWSYTSAEARLWKPDFSGYHALEGHKDAILDAAFSPDGKWIATVGQDSFLILWNGDGSPAGTKFRAGEIIKSVLFNPLNEYLYTLSIEGNLVRFNLKGEIIDTFARLSYNQDFDLSPDGKFLAACFTDTLKILGEGGPLITLKEDRSIVQLRFSAAQPGDQLCYQILALYDDMRSVALYEFCPGPANPTFTLINNYDIQDEEIIDAAIDRDGRLILLGAKGTIRIFSENWHNPEAEDYSFLDFSAGGQDKYRILLHPTQPEMAITSLNLDVHLWNLDANSRIYQPVFQRQAKNGSYSVVYQLFPEAGFRIVLDPTAGDPDSLILQEIDSGKTVMRSGYEPDFNPIWHFSPTGTHFAVRFQDTTLQLQLRNRQGDLIKTIASPDDPIQDFQFSPDGKTLAWMAGRKVYFTNTETGGLLSDISLEGDYERLGYAQTDPDVILLVSKPDETDKQHILNLHLKKGPQSRTEAPKTILPVWGFDPVPHSSDWVLVNHTEAMIFNAQSATFRSIKESGNNAIYQVNPSPDGKWYLMMNNAGLTITRKEAPNTAYLKVPDIATANFSKDMQWLYLQYTDGELKKWPWSTTAIFDRIRKLKLADLDPVEKALYLNR